MCENSPFLPILKENLKLLSVVVGCLDYETHRVSNNVFEDDVKEFAACLQDSTQYQETQSLNYKRGEKPKASALRLRV